MDFDTYTVALLVLREDAPKMDEAALDALQDAHLAHLAKLHEEGHLLAAGPALGAPDRRIRGFSIFRDGPEETRALVDEDPAVRAGRFDHEIFPWMVPRGAAHFTRTRFPHSAAEAAAPSEPTGDSAPG